MKLTAPHRVASEPRLKDFTVIAHALIDAAPQRMIWGSDYSHRSNAHRANSVDLFDLVALRMPGAATRQKILVDNPPSVFEF